MSVATRTSPKRRVSSECIPKQHVAWAMLFLPYIVGVILRVQSGEVPAY